jgi:hypothetical protein
LIPSFSTTFDKKTVDTPTLKAYNPIIHRINIKVYVMRTTTMKTIIIMMAILTSFAMPSSANDYRDLTHMNYEWYINNYKKIDQIIASGTNDEAIPVINILGLI